MYQIDLFAGVLNVNVHPEAINHMQIKVSNRAADGECVRCGCGACMPVLVLDPFPH